jgi:hypothetical protein
MKHVTAVGTAIISHNGEARFVLSIPHESKQEEKIFSDTKHSIQ